MAAVTIEDVKWAFDLAWKYIDVADDDEMFDRLEAVRKTVLEAITLLLELAEETPR